MSRPPSTEDSVIQAVRALHLLGVVSNTEISAAAQISLSMVSQLARGARPDVEESEEEIKLRLDYEARAKRSQELLTFLKKQTESVVLQRRKEREEEAKWDRVIAELAEQRRREREGN